MTKMVLGSYIGVFLIGVVMGELLLVIPMVFPSMLQYWKNKMYLKRLKKESRWDK